MEYWYKSDSEIMPARAWALLQFIWAFVAAWKMRRKRKRRVQLLVAVTQTPAADRPTHPPRVGSIVLMDCTQTSPTLHPPVAPLSLSHNNTTRAHTRPSSNLFLLRRNCVQLAHFSASPSILFHPSLGRKVASVHRVLCSCRSKVQKQNPKLK